MNEYLQINSTTALFFAYSMLNSQVTIEDLQTKRSDVIIIKQIIRAYMFLCLRYTYVYISTLECELLNFGTNDHSKIILSLKHHHFDIETSHKYRRQYSTFVEEMKLTKQDDNYVEIAQLFLTKPYSEALRIMKINYKITRK